MQVTNKFGQAAQWVDTLSEIGAANANILSVNVRSLLKSITKLRQLELHKNIKILILTEVWEMDSRINMEIKGFNLAAVATREKKRSGGVCIYVAENIQYTTIHNLTYTKNDTLELATIKVNLFGHNIIITGCYRSPATKLEISLNQLYNYLSKLHESETPTKLILTGDMNYDTIKDNDTNWNKLFSKFNLYNAIDLPTRPGKNNATCIDHVYTNFLLPRPAYVTDLILADHFAVGATVVENGGKPATRTKVQTRLSLSNNDICSLVKGLDDVNWQNVIREGFDAFLDLLKQKIKIHCERKLRIKSFKEQPWFTTELKNLERKIKLQARKLKNKYDETKYNQYRDLKRQYKSKERQARSAYVKNRLSGATPKETWRVINDLLCRKSGPSTIDKLITEDNVTLTKKSDVIERLNNFYCDIGEKLSKELPQATDDPADLVLATKSSFCVNELTYDDILAGMRRMSNKTSHSHDLLPNLLLKKICLSIIEPLHYFINKMLMEGSIPTSLKTSHTIFLKKKPNAIRDTDFRPICLVPAILKLADKIFTFRLDQYMRQESLWAPEQHGYQKAKSTETALFETIIPMQLNINKGQYVTMLCFDCRKAFDCLNEHILANKVTKYGIKGNEAAFLKSYMTNRCQIGKLNGELSTIRQQKIGCPQGGVLSCVSYILYNNDIPRAVENARTIMYSDDTTCIIETDNKEENAKISNKTLEKVGNWFTNNRLTLNTQKTLYMTFHKKDKNLDLPLYIRDEKITRVGRDKINETTKLLGLILDQNLSFKQHYQHVLGKVRAACFALKTIKHFVRWKERLMIYRSLVESNLRYCVILWGPFLTQKQLKTLETLQKRAVRNVAGMQYNAHTDPLFSRYKILRFRELLQREYILWVFRAKNGLLPAKSTELILNDAASDYACTRSKEHKLARNTAEVPTICEMKREWNTLPDHILETKDPNLFKTLTLGHYLNKYNSICNRKDCIECTTLKATPSNDFGNASQ